MDDIDKMGGNNPVPSSRREWKGYSGIRSYGPSSDTIRYVVYYIHRDKDMSMGVAFQISGFRIEAWLLWVWLLLLRPSFYASSVVAEC